MSNSIAEAIQERQLGYPGVSARLDKMSVDDVIYQLGPCDREVRSYQETGWITRPDGTRGPAWKVGDGKPALATDDPGVVVAMNLCATARNPWATPRMTNERHPGACGFCEYPVSELLLAISHATYFARLVRDHLLVWRGTDGATYVRAGQEDGAYLNTGWADFAALHPGDQRRYAAEVVEAVRQGVTA